MIEPHIPVISFRRAVNDVIDLLVSTGNFLTEFAQSRPSLESVLPTKTTSSSPLATPSPKKLEDDIFGLLDERKVLTEQLLTTTALEVGGHVVQRLKSSSKAEAPVPDPARPGNCAPWRVARQPCAFRSTAAPRQRGNHSLSSFTRSKVAQWIQTEDVTLGPSPISDESVVLRQELTG